MWSAEMKEVKAKKGSLPQVLKLAGTLALIDHVRAEHLGDPALQDVTMRQLRDTKACCAAAFNEAIMLRQEIERATP